VQVHSGVLREQSRTCRGARSLWQMCHGSPLKALPCRRRLSLGLDPVYRGDCQPLPPRHGPHPDPAGHHGQTWGRPGRTLGGGSTIQPRPAQTPQTDTSDKSLPGTRQPPRYNRKAHHALDTDRRRLTAAIGPSLVGEEGADWSIDAVTRCCCLRLHRC
jgi:hypothetical protein